MTWTGPAARFNLGQLVGCFIAVAPTPDPLSHGDGRGERDIVLNYCGKSSATLAFISSTSLIAETVIEPSTIDFSASATASLVSCATSSGRSSKRTPPFLTSIV